MTHSQTRYHATHVLTPRSYAPHGYAGAAFKETVRGSGSPVTGYLTGQEADLMIGRAAARGSLGAVHESGAFVLSRSGQARSDEMVRTLNFVAHPRRLTTRQLLDLELIEHREDRARVVTDENGAPTVVAGTMWRIPPAAAGLLLNRGWLSRSPHADDVWISAAGRMAMAWHWHRAQGLPTRLLKGLYLDAALTAADTARRRLEHHARPLPA